MNGTPSSREQARKEGASQAINNFNNELWETFRLSERFRVERPDGNNPTERKQDTIKRLEALMLYCYREGAWRGTRELLKMQKEAGVDISRRDWKRAVRERFGKRFGRTKVDL